MLAGGAYPAIMAMGLLRGAPSHPFSLEGNVRWQTGAYPGGRLAGMAAAMSWKLGYRCTILKPGAGGGRCCERQEGLEKYRDRTRTAYGKPGSGTIFQCRPLADPASPCADPSLCRELNVPIQVYNNVNEALIIQRRQGTLVQ